MAGQARWEAARGLFLSPRSRSGASRRVLEDTLSTAIVDGALDAIVAIDASGRIVEFNPQAERMFGYSREEAIDGDLAELLIPPAERDRHRASLARVAAGGDSTLLGGRVEMTAMRRDGSEFPVELTVNRVDGPDGEPLFIGFVRDITERAEASDAHQRLAAIVESSDDAIFSKSMDGTILTWNRGAERLYGYRADEVVGRPVAILSPMDRAEEMADILDRLVDCQRIEHLETVRIRRDGARVDVSLTISPIHDATGRAVACSVIARDITDRKRAEAQIAFLAYHDKLTGLANRAKFEEVLGMALARARRHRMAVAVLYLDLDDFKLVNDSLGHTAGDELLRQVAGRLTQASRETDAVARMGGDEFLILLPDLPLRDPGPRTDPHADATAAVAAVSTRIHDLMRRPFVLQEREVYISSSVGVSIFPIDAVEARHLLANADVAMYRSKRSGPGRTALFASEPGNANSLSMMMRLRQAAQDHAWRLEFQPIVDLHTGRMVSAEALIRWNDAELGNVPPERFIPLAEETGLIDAIGDWVVDELLARSKEWATRGPDIDVSFNVSPRQLWGPDLVDRLLSRVEGAGVDPRRLVMEITESTAMIDAERTLLALKMLSARGFRFAVDDFGTGHSSLARLTDLPIDIIKVDRSFVHEVCRRDDAATMVRAIIHLALSLGMVPVAEGIETAEQCRFLVEQGCRLGQGFYFSPSVPPEEIGALHVRGFGHLIGP
jgi:diguanylate cyclase (GGDEF)-like protein/PAS domain S-box-containing protein